MYPNGEAGRLMSRLAWPCAHCGGAFHEPLDDGREAPRERSARRAHRLPRPRGGRPERASRSPRRRARSDARRRGEHDHAPVRRPGHPPPRGRGAAARRGPLHGRHRPRPAHAPRDDRALAVRPRPHPLDGRVGRAGAARRGGRRDGRADRRDVAPAALGHHAAARPTTPPPTASRASWASRSPSSSPSRATSPRTRPT